MPSLTPQELGARLRAARRRAKRTQVEAAGELDLSQPQFARYESGRYVPRPDQVEALCRLYGMDGDTTRELATAAHEIREGNTRVIMTRDSANAQREIGKLERQASLIRSFSPSGLPGLLQSGDYVRALFTTGGEVTPEDEAGAAERLVNQQLLADQAASRRFVLLLPEGSLGFPALLAAGSMASQVEHIAEVSRQPNIRVGIIPWGRKCPEMVLNSWEMYDETAVVIGAQTGTNFLTNQADVKVYSDLFRFLEQLAVYDDAAREILARVADQYRSLGG